MRVVEKDGMRYVSYDTSDITEEYKSSDIYEQLSSIIVSDQIVSGMTDDEYAKFLGIPRYYLMKYRSGDYDFRATEISDICNRLRIYLLISPEGRLKIYRNFNTGESHDEK